MFIDRRVRLGVDLAIIDMISCLRCGWQKVLTEWVASPRVELPYSPRVRCDSSPQAEPSSPSQLVEKENEDTDIMIRRHRVYQNAISDDRIREIESMWPVC